MKYAGKIQMDRLKKGRPIYDEVDRFPEEPFKPVTLEDAAKAFEIIAGIFRKAAFKPNFPKGGMVSEDRGEVIDQKTPNQSQGFST